MKDKYDATKYERPSVTVDVLLFTVEDNELKVLLVKRDEAPFEDSWALPGGFVKMNESLDEAADRELSEETGVRNLYLEQLYTFGNPNRDPRTRVITITYMALTAKSEWKLKSSGDVKEAKFFSVGKLPKLAFDHTEIIKYGLQRLRNKLGYTNIVLGLLPGSFTLTELQRVYEIILKTKIDKRNFRKKILSTGLIVASGKKLEGIAHRPAMLYSFKNKKVVITD
ncbi:TPA: NUDIX hydrolase [Candidatus Collierbacteria bacterium]|uniref:NUDIX hydrolase n=1 Tax=Candidatus Collierbacteria bacterium GW2011_GWB2_44_22 TaxID=1618387 RepID=A0A0G1HYB2_9BACT|nr:MAG: NUDIX hydrolase [Candidatus Collierbacteria bacterium GW2011_GWA2_44_13]KKT51088.1 MAG: NUDIX hydrolase [Candidatus Collierbacteria bacterium GW2011_GWB1_44_197]KKT52116.1 MAG: NUDIX hydrolase [Candidatus Collierbacteria bacterium GW2011_GWB2_44_22]KKT63107.1 MAG: NUDIX hydrolase [Candidatus Collierbacteria bacterium GW2011_GWD1_44_27]KKT66319.1 MAG: NUDIX hydrolase [Candidatus Collierbacteria bacterium GW2011_GWC2_44_30]KKT68992.1 MAG: NUDIX hydrolase, 7,8-dihydro-8-oxoguanine triphos